MRKIKQFCKAEIAKHTFFTTNINFLAKCLCNSKFLRTFAIDLKRKRVNNIQTTKQQTL